MLNLPTITQIPTTRAGAYAFSIHGKVTRDDMTAMSDYMNDRFDTHDTVDMLLIFDRYDGSEAGASLSWDSIKSRFRSLTSVGKYVVVGAPDAAESMIETMDHIMPVKATTFDRADEAMAWAEIDAQRA